VVAADEVDSPDETFGQDRVVEIGQKRRSARRRSLSRKEGAILLEVGVGGLRSERVERLAAGVEMRNAPPRPQEREDSDR